MTLSSFMTTTATTQRRGAPAGALDKTPAFATYLEGVAITPVMQPSAKGEHSAKAIAGMNGVATYQVEAFTESNAHTKNSAPVTELPDIRAMDKIAIDSVVYIVKLAKVDTATSSFGKTLYLYLDRDNT